MLRGDVEARSARLFVRCDAGTYVRVLCEELGKRLDLPARMGALLRMAAGPFKLAESCTPAQIARSLESCLIDPLGVLTQSRYDVDRVRALRFCAGNEIDLETARADRAAPESGVSGDVLVAHEGSLLGTAVVVTRDAIDGARTDASRRDAWARLSNAAFANGLCRHAHRPLHRRV